MLDAERSARSPDPVVAAMDRQVLAYLRGEQPLKFAVDACVRALGSRPVLAVSVAHANAAMRARLQSLQDALDALSRGTG